MDTQRDYNVMEEILKNPPKPLSFKRIWSGIKDCAKKVKWFFSEYWVHILSIIIILGILVAIFCFYMIMILLVIGALLALKDMFR